MFPMFAMALFLLFSRGVAPLIRPLHTCGTSLFPVSARSQKYAAARLHCFHHQAQQAREG